VRCRVCTSLILPLFGAWPPGLRGLWRWFQRLSHEPLRRHPDSQTPKVYQLLFTNAKMAGYRLSNDFEAAVCQHLSAYRFASPPEGPSYCTSPINTCTHRDPSGFSSFGPRRNDSAGWTTTRHIDLTLSISSPMFFPSLAGTYLSHGCFFCEAFLQPCTSYQLAVF
jgi:hypothetical protein